MKNYNYEYQYPVPLAANCEQVFKALIDEQALKAWFAEHAEIEQREAGSFRFWGKHTYGTSSPEQATQKVLRMDSPRLLAFSWHLLGRDSKVTWTLSEEDTDQGVITKITVNHDFDELPDINRAEELIDDLWRIYTGNLCFYIKGETDMFRPDFGNDDPEVRHEITINAIPAKVFAALITPEYIKQWFPAPNPVVDPRVGGDYGFGYSFEKDGETVELPAMKILEFVANEKLAISWPDWRGDPQIPDQKVTWLLEDLGDKTRLILLHSGFTRAVDVSDYPFGWAEFMNQIGKVSESI